MIVSRRAFTAGAASFALAGPLTAAPAPTLPAGVAAALGAIRAYAEAHRAFWGLPALTLGLTSPSGFETVLDFGHANRELGTPITPGTLFQIGSISKVMTALVVHQLAQERRLQLDADVAALLPGAPVPGGQGITVQRLLDHNSGLPRDAPAFPPGGLWLGFRPGERWYYSNTGYDLLGKLAETVGGRPLARLLHERLFVPLGMGNSRGAIVSADRALYAQGYEWVDMAAPFVRGDPLAPAGWVDVTFGSGNVASTAADINRFMRALAALAQGRATLGLGASAARAFIAHAVPSEPPRVAYGNGLMRVADAGRAYLHHTGGMLAFSSAFHLDRASGVGAFASSTITGYAGYRPRSLTLFAVQALSAAEAGRPLPAPPALEAPVATPGDYPGRYSEAGQSLEITAGTALTLVSGGRAARLHALGEDRFSTAHPAFREHLLWFERVDGKVARLNWGPRSYAKAGAPPVRAAPDRALARLAGRFVNDSPWLGTLHVFERGGRLWLGSDTPLFAIGPNRWRVGEESWSPERVAFADFLAGRPQTLLLSGEKFVRHDV